MGKTSIGNSSHVVELQIHILERKSILNYVVIICEASKSQQRKCIRFIQNCQVNQDFNSLQIAFNYLQIF